MSKSDNFDRTNLYASFQAYYPNRLLQRKAKEAKKLFLEAKELNFDEKLDFEEDFFDRFSTFGWYFDDSDLNVEEMLLDLKKYIKHNQGGYVDNRWYDWFTSVSSSFRKHIVKDDKHFIEAYDFHAGMFWMLSIYGAKHGLISFEETDNMIDEAFYGSFYERISEQPKNKKTKQLFMVYANSHKGIHMQMYKSEDLNERNAFRKISDNFWKSYPEWSRMLLNRRDEFKGDIGFHNFIDSTEIEKDIFLKLKEKLESLGYTNIRRVHDAIYTTDDIDYIETIVRETVDEYIADFIEEE